jgi:hypothetical protein
MLRAILGKDVHTVKRAGTYAAKVPPQELHKIAVHVRAVGETSTKGTNVIFVPIQNQNQNHLFPSTDTIHTSYLFNDKNS